MLKIILFNAPPYSGKDMVAEGVKNILLQNNVPCRIEKFASILKDCVHIMFPYAIEIHNMCLKNPELKDNTFPQLLNMSYREVCIKMSEQAIKPTFGKGIFGWVLGQKLKQEIGGIILISDCGFIDEVNALMNCLPSDSYGLIKIFREGCSFASDSRQWIDENKLDKHIKMCYTLQNNATKEQAITEAYNQIMKGMFNEKHHRKS